MPDPVPADRLPARSNAQARDRYHHFLQRSLSVVDQSAVWLAQLVPRNPGLWTMRTEPSIIGLKKCTTQDRLYLRATQRFSYDDHPDHPGERKIVTRDYAYTLSDSPDQRPERYSWQ